MRSTVAISIAARATFHSGIGEMPMPIAQAFSPTQALPRRFENAPSRKQSSHSQSSSTPADSAACGVVAQALRREVGEEDRSDSTHDLTLAGRHGRGRGGQPRPGPPAPGARPEPPAARNPRRPPQGRPPRRREHAAEHRGGRRRARPQQLGQPVVLRPGGGSPRRWRKPSRTAKSKPTSSAAFTRRAIARPRTAARAPSMRSSSRRSTSSRTNAYSPSLLPKWWYSAPVVTSAAAASSPTVTSSKGRAPNSRTAASASRPLGEVDTGIHSRNRHNALCCSKIQLRHGGCP